LPLRQFAPGRFAPIRFAPGNIQHFLLIQLKPKQHHLDVYHRRTGLATLSSVGAVL